MMKSTFLLVILLIVLARPIPAPIPPPIPAPKPLHCEGRLEFIAVPSNNTAELYAEGEDKGNLRTLIRTLTLVDGVRSRQSYEAKSYGNCCWTLYSK